MKIVEPKVELWEMGDNPISHIAKCARVCYASDGKNDKLLVKSLIKNKHLSMLRHQAVYLIIPETLFCIPSAFIDADYVLFNGKYHVSINKESYDKYWKIYSKYIISKEEAENNEIFYKHKLLRYTFCIETGIDITRELNRKSPNNIAEQSTRYVDFIKKVGIRFKKCHWMNKLNLYKRFLVYIMAKTIEIFYKISRSKYGLNLPPQDARWILALDTMSKVAYTYTVRDWEYIINMRLFDWTGTAHPDVKTVAKQIKELLENEGYVIENYKFTK